MPHPLFHADADAALLPAARVAYDTLLARHALHRYVLHVRSSQAFALNLFAPLDDNSQRGMFAGLGVHLTDVAPMQFEYVDAADRLGETTSGPAHRTQVDVFASGTDAHGNRIVALIEVKFTEIDFSGCSAYANPNNPARDVCRTPGLFGGDTERCFQLSSHGRGRRRYDDYLTAAPTITPAGLSDGGGCLVRTGRNQPMRNLALAEVLLRHREADHVIYALCAPATHPTIWRRFAELTDAFPDTPTRSIRPIIASSIAALHPDGGTAVAAMYPADDAGLRPPGEAG